MGLEEPQLFFDVVVHFGTLIAVVLFFRKDIGRMARETMARVGGRKGDGEGLRLLIWILVSSIPTALIGIFFRDFFESLFAQPRIVGGMLLVTGLLLWMTRYAQRDGKGIERMRWSDALWIGLAQGMAIIPGISRSGATISTGLFCGIDRELSGRFSFLLSVPAILGALLFELREFELASGFWTNLVGMTVAFGVGLLSLMGLMKVIKAGRISSFAYYCWGVGILMILLAK